MGTIHLYWILTGSSFAVRLFLMSSDCKKKSVQLFFSPIKTKIVVEECIGDHPCISKIREEDKFTATEATEVWKKFF
jgi:hypothetical protein